jgi:glycosyltransferase involved in cell wall biosynthesis
MISFVIPVYNVVSLLTKTVNSILDQATTDVEILLIDDGSSDGSGELCDALALQHPQIRVIHQVNSGPSKARNAGIDAAVGDYLFFMDSDDLLAQDAFAAMVKSVSNYPLMDLHIGQVLVRHMNTLMVEEKINYHHFEYYHALSGRDALILMMDRYQFVQSVYSYVISRRLIDSVGLRFNPAWRNFEDFDFTVQAYLAALKVAIINQPLLVYSKERRGQITSSVSLSRISSNVEVTYQWIDHCFEQSDSIVYRSILSYLAHNYLFWLGDLRKLPKSDQMAALQMLMPLTVLLHYVKKPTLKPFVWLYHRFGFKTMVHAIIWAKHFKK